MRRTGRLLFLLVAVSSLLLHAGSYAQSASGDNNRKRAFDLYKQDKHLEALPLFEELAIKSPDDRDVLVGLGVCLVSEAATLDDQDAASKERVRARQVLLKAKKLGSTAPLMENLLEMLPEDGVVKYENTPADQAMHAAEAAFSGATLKKRSRTTARSWNMIPKTTARCCFLAIHTLRRRIGRRQASGIRKPLIWIPTKRRPTDITPTCC